MQNGKRLAGEGWYCPAIHRVNVSAHDGICHLFTGGMLGIRLAREQIEIRGRVLVMFAGRLDLCGATVLSKKRC